MEDTANYNYLIYLVAYAVIDLNVVWGCLLVCAYVGVLDRKMDRIWRLETDVLTI